MVDPLAHWNDILTVAAFLVAATTGYFQIQDFRERPAQPKLKWVDTPEFRSRSGSESGNTCEALFNFSAIIENEGRNRFTLSRITIEPEYGERAEMELQEYEESGAAEFDGHSSRRLSFSGKTTLRNPHTDEVKTVVQLETPAGNDSVETTFTCLERRWSTRRACRIVCKLLLDRATGRRGLFLRLRSF